MAALEQQQERTNGEPVVDWGMAAFIARQLAGTGPDVPVDEAVTAVRQLRGMAATAERHVRDLTGLGTELPILPGDVVDRAGWVQAAAEGLAVLTAGGFGAVVAPSRIAAGAAGLQAGVA